MRVVFAGTPPFAATALEALLHSGHELVLVLSQPDRPAGRGLKLTPSAVSRLAAAHALALHRPASLKTPESQVPLRDARPDVMVVAAYGLILPQAVLDIPRLGCLNIHASLLPRWRGAAPVQRALLAGDRETGVGIMRMEAGLDTGPVLLEKRVAIGPRDTAGSLTERLGRLGAEALLEALTNLQSLTPRPQDAPLATYAGKITRAEALLDWTLPAMELDRRVRAYNPAPGAETVLHGQPLKVWEALVSDASGNPGQLLVAGPDFLRIACGQGSLDLVVLQKAGSRRAAVREFLQGHRLEAGTLLGH